MVIDEGLGIDETTRRLGISVKTLANRVTKYRQSGEVSACAPDQAVEISRLRREVAQLRMERDIVKKSDGVLCPKVAVRYAMIAKLRLEYPVWLLCKMLLMVE